MKTLTVSFFGIRKATYPVRSDVAARAGDVPHAIIPEEQPRASLLASLKKMKQNLLVTTGRCPPVFLYTVKVDYIKTSITEFSIAFDHLELIAECQ